MRPNIIFPAKLFQRGNVNYYLNNITFGFLYPVMNYISAGYTEKRFFFITEKDDVIKINDVTSLDKNNFGGDYLDFPYAIKNMVREKPNLKIDDNYEFSWEQTHVIDVDKNGIIARLENGDLYKIYLAKNLPQEVIDLAKSKKDTIVGRFERCVAFKINQDIVYLAQTLNGYATVTFNKDDYKAIKMGTGTSPFIKAPKMFNDFYMLSPFKSGTNLYAIAYNAKDSKLYFVDTSTKKSFDIYLIDSPIVDVLQKNANVATILCKNGDLIEINFDNASMNKIDTGVEAVGIYWTETKGIAPSCMRHCRVMAQRNYIVECQGNDLSKCNTPSGWAGVDNSMIYSSYNKAVNVAINPYKFRLSTTGDYNFGYKKGICVYKKDGEWISLSKNFAMYKADGNNVKSNCKYTDKDILETIQIYDFYTSNQHKNKLLYTNYLQSVGNFEKDMSAGYVPVRITRDISEIKLRF